MVVFARYSLLWVRYEFSGIVFRKDLTPSHLVHLPRLILPLAGSIIQWWIQSSLGICFLTFRGISYKLHPAYFLLVGGSSSSLPKRRNFLLACCFMSLRQEPLRNILRRCMLCSWSCSPHRWFMLAVPVLQRFFQYLWEVCDTV